LTRVRRLLADENVPMVSVRALRINGFDVSSIAEDSPGIADRQVLQRAREQGRWLITLDRDYGELIFRNGEPPPPGVLYLRIVPLDPEEPARCVEDALRRFLDDGVFLVVGRGTNVRERVFPGHVRG
jgi:predicted nuclease of predicted toxin-antitoxin system